MFDFEPAKILIVGAVALIVVGPKELPRVLRQVGQTLGKARRMAAEMQGQFMEALREADQDPLNKEILDISEAVKFKNPLDGLREASKSIQSALQLEPQSVEQTSEAGSQAVANSDLTFAPGWEPPKTPLQVEGVGADGSASVFMPEPSASMADFVRKPTPASPVNIGPAITTSEQAQAEPLVRAPTQISPTAVLDDLDIRAQTDPTHNAANPTLAGSGMAAEEAAGAGRAVRKLRAKRARAARQSASRAGRSL